MNEFLQTFSIRKDKRHSYDVAHIVKYHFREFNTMVELGCGRGYVSRHMLKDTAKTIYQCELSEKLLVSFNIPTIQSHSSSLNFLGMLHNSRIVVT